jgi:predicted flap endonuclease-1-like 5' DNA nuclease
MNPGKLIKRLSLWQALLNLLVVSVTLGLFIYWRKYQQQAGTDQHLEIPFKPEPVYPAQFPEPVIHDSDGIVPDRAEKPQTAEPDNLQRIEGIGPKIASLLKAAGVTTFQHIAEREVEEIRAILAESGVRANPSTWPEQARLAASGKWDELTNLQSQIKSGRRID